MAQLTLNMFDIGVLIIIGLSALLSFFRGFVREVLSLGAWLVASVVALRFMADVSHYIKPQVKSDVVANGIASIGLFFITLILVSIATSFIIKVLKPGAKVGLFDNLVGLCFGVARGVLIVAIGYFILTVVMVEKDYPDWLKKAQTRPYIAKVSAWVGTLTPDYLDAITSKDGKKKLNDSESDLEASGEKATHRAQKKIETDTEADEDMPESSLPSMEDLQQRIREENARHQEER